MIARLWPSVLVAWLVLASVPAEAEDPDFDAFLALIERTLASSGPGSQQGDRSEMYRRSDEGWEVQMMVAWDESAWRLLALRLHHPARIETVEGEWQQRYERLLRVLDTESLPDLSTPDLFEVPPPDYLPALPGEFRSRRFSHGGFWYEARWINDGGLDDRAQWALRSYELVAIP